MNNSLKFCLIILFMFSLWLITSPVKAASFMSKGLIGYWKFDGTSMSGTTALDDSGGGNNLILQAGSPTRTMSKIGQGLMFNGTTDCLGTSAYDPFSSAHAAGTMSVWVNPTSLGSAYHDVFAPWGYISFGWEGGRLHGNCL